MGATIGGIFLYQQQVPVNEPAEAFPVLVVGAFFALMLQSQMMKRGTIRKSHAD